MKRDGRGALTAGGSATPHFLRQYFSEESDTPSARQYERSDPVCASARATRSRHSFAFSDLSFDAIF
jgi:hypothetical protein